jgi:LysM repeat protein
MTQETKKQVAAAAATIIFANEGNYGSINADDNGAVSIGKVQWHGNRALSLLKSILAVIEVSAKDILGEKLYQEIASVTDWAKRTVSAEEKEKLSKLISTTAGKQEQDKLAEKDILAYVEHGIANGIEDRKSLVYYADMENQGGKGASKRVGKAAAVKAGAAEKVTLDIIHEAALEDTVMGKYTTRRNKVYKKAKELFQTSEEEAEGTTMSMSEKELRAAVIRKAREFLGDKESDGSHQEIIDTYNAHKPLARGCKVSYKDSWCATYVSVIAILMELTDIIPTECSCEKQIELFEKLGCWEEDGTIVPDIADVIYYNWDDSTQENDGWADHTGYVSEIAGNTLTITEGNYQDSVKERKIQIGAGNIRGYGRPEYAKKASSIESDSASEKEESVKKEPAQNEKEAAEIKDEAQIYIVKKGDTLSQIATKFGTTYQKLASYNGIPNPGKISVGQKIEIPGASTQSYTVKSGESLWSIASKTLGDGTRWNEIKTLNGLKTDTIRTGDVLKIPKK